MFRVYTCVATEHDLTTLAIAALICAFGSLISFGVGQRSFPKLGRVRAIRLCLTGMLTGLTIWSTHFAAMLAYTPSVDIHFKGLATLASVILTMAVAICGWFVLASAGPWRGVIGGALFGAALCIAHFVDMMAIEVGGLVSYDRDLILLAVATGFPLCILSGVLLQRGQLSYLPWRSASSLTAGVLLLHLIAMGAVHIVPLATEPVSVLGLGDHGQTVLVMASAALILLISVGLVWHELEVARATSDDRERLRLSEEHYRFSVELNPQIPWIADAEGGVVEISPRWAQIVGEPHTEALGASWSDKVHPDDIEEVWDTWNGALATGDPRHADVRYRLLQANGSYRWYRARANPRLDERGDVTMWYGSLEDIHEQVTAELALRASEERYRLASLATNDVIWDMALDDDTVAWTGAVEAVLGYAEAKFGTTHQWWVDRLHPDERDEVLAFFEAMLESNLASWEREYRFRQKDGSYTHFLSRGIVVRDPAGKAERMVGSTMDITARKHSEGELRWAAHHDPLTQLPNRKLFSLRLDAMLAHAEEHHTEAGLIIIDVDQFKLLNDTLGHNAGDAMLREVADQLVQRVPPGTTVARLGGDEFAIILPDLADIISRYETLESVVGGTDVPVTYEGRQFDITLSVGAARYPKDGEVPEALLRSADLALYAAKAAGPGKAQAFKSSMRKAADSEKRMLRNAREALSEEQIVAFYQPKICLRTGAIVGFEALLRWHNSAQGIRPPSSLFAAFDDPRLSPALTDRMLEQTISHMTEWLTADIPFGSIAINGSPEDFRRGDLDDRILGSLAKAGIAPALFELEVTETVFLGKHAAAVERALHSLHDEGVTIALDDFGTGYASLTHLKQFPVDTLKIDRSFILKLISQDQQDAVIVGTLIDLAKNLGISTVAEGVETELQAFMLRRRGCDTAQGFFFGRPLPAMRVPGFINGWDASRMALFDGTLKSAGDIAQNS
jgi:diguanylate cyclase (GGDEF)-like protein/PAS domain S-box-containing protein